MAGLFQGKVALVTGGSSGIGRAAAVAFAREGARVAARREIRGEQTVAQIRGWGGEAVFVKTDVSESAQVEAMVAATIEAFGRLGCAFNNAESRAPMRAPTSTTRTHRTQSSRLTSRASGSA